ncbi:hypothetical protein PO124_20740 [Bacillus licheniformis]|nr:hypothetical protein [Bacillus licheniformis]
MTAPTKTVLYSLPPAADQRSRRKVVKTRCKRIFGQGYSDLAPMYRGAAGINELNALLQGILNPPKPKGREMKYGDVVYRTGDKVLQLVNQPEHNVFNGDMGEIVSIFMQRNTEKKIWPSSL